jgi:hypothetical protein
LEQAESKCTNGPSFNSYLAFCGLRDPSHPLLANPSTNPLRLRDTAHMLDPLCSADESAVGSSGIVMALRWLVYQKLTEEGLWDQYEFFVLTRADHIFLCPHPPISFFQQQRDHIFVFGDESYGGYTDRHMAGFRQAFRTALNVTQALVCEPKAFANVETALAVYWQHAGLEVSEVPRTAFAVRAPGDPATWSRGTYLNALSPFNLTAKYPVELHAVRDFCFGPTAGEHPSEKESTERQLATYAALVALWQQVRDDVSGDGGKGWHGLEIAPFRRDGNENWSPTVMGRGSNQISWSSSSTQPINMWLGCAAPWTRSLSSETRLSKDEEERLFELKLVKSKRKAKRQIQRHRQPRSHAEQAPGR